MMDLVQLRTFLAVAEEEHLTRAAERQHLSQSAAGAHVKAIEESFGLHEAFGPGRCMMESNFPVDKQSCGYGLLWNAMKRITSNYTPSDKAALYAGTAARVYRLAAATS